MISNLESVHFDFYFTHKIYVWKSNAKCFFICDVIQHFSAQWEDIKNIQ